MNRARSKTFLVSRQHRRKGAGVVACFVAAGLVELTGARLLAQPPPTPVQNASQERSSTSAKRPSEFLDYSNDRRPMNYREWGVFMGTGWTPEVLRENLDKVRTGFKKWDNPFEGKPFDNDTPFFAFGNKGAGFEAARVVGNHLDLFTTRDEVSGYRFKFVLCHSNGCTQAINAHRRGQIEVEHFLALGTDWTQKNFEPGELGSAKITFFAHRGDLVPRIPVPEWNRVTEDTPGLAFEIPFENLSDIPRGLGSVASGGPPNPDRFRFVKLDPPPGQEARLTQPVAPHALTDSYFRSISKWMREPVSVPFRDELGFGRPNSSRSGTISKPGNGFSAPTPAQSIPRVTPGVIGKSGEGFVPPPPPPPPPSGPPPSPPPPPGPGGALSWSHRGRGALHVPNIRDRGGIAANIEINASDFEEENDR